MRIPLVIGLAALSAAVVWGQARPSAQEPSPPHSSASPADGVIVFFPTSDCPGHFTPLDAARGRVFVALPEGGTVAGIVGDALGDQGEREIVDVAEHMHLVDPPATNSADDSHGHQVDRATSVREPGNSNGVHGATAGNHSIESTSNGDHSHAFTVPSLSTASAGVETSNATIPYVQLLACELVGDTIPFPQGATAFVSGATCPEGWTELTEARGRVVVVTDEDEHLGATVGTALDDLGLRMMTEVSSHAHEVDPAEMESAANGQHGHWIATQTVEAGGGSDNQAQEPQFASNSMNTDSDSHRHTVNFPPTSSEATGSPSGVDITMPYIQLLLCEKQ